MLLAMGYSPLEALGALRLTLGHTTTEADVDLALQAVPAAVARLRGAGTGGGSGSTPSAWPESGRRVMPRGASALVAMSGGVDSSVAAALMLREGHEVVGATMKLWGGPSDSGCCSVADVEDARRVAQQLGIAHHVFNFTADFERDVVGPYVAGHARGPDAEPVYRVQRPPKFDRFLERACLLGFDAIATGHHARVTSVARVGLAAAPRAATWPRTSRTCCTCWARPN